MKLVHLLTILALGERADGLNPAFKQAQRAIKALPIMGNSEVGYFGGAASFAGVDDVLGKGARDLRKLFGVDGKPSSCPEHGVQPVWVGHIFPRALGGIMLPNDRLNLRPECKKCNEERYTLLTKAQRAYISKITIKGFELD